MAKPVHVEVHIRDQEQFIRMLKKFSRKVKKLGILDEVKERRYFTKKSEKKRLKRKNKKRRSQESTNKHKEALKD